MILVKKDFINDNVKLYLMPVVITRAKDDSQSFAELLVKASVKAEDLFYFPCLDFVNPDDDFNALDDAIRKNQEFDWLVFLSKRAADSFFSRVLDLGGHFFHLAQHLKIAVVGPATREFIENDVNFPVDFCPNEFNSDSFAKEFKLNCTDDTNYLNPLKLLLPRTSIADSKLIEDLEESKKIEVVQVDAYKTVKPTISDDLIGKFKDLLVEMKAENQFLKLSFTSSQCVRNFFETINSNFDLKEFIANIEFYSIGPKVTATLGEEIYKIISEPDFKLTIFQSEEATLGSLVEKIVNRQAFKE